MTINKSDCEKETIKVGENNVEVRYFIQTKDNKKIYVEQLMESYGRDRIEAEKTQAQAEYDRWDNMDQVEIDKEKAAAAARIDELAEIDEKLNEEVEES